MAKKNSTKNRPEIEDEEDGSPTETPGETRDHNEQGDPTDPLHAITAAINASADLSVRAWRFREDGTREGIGRYDAAGFDPMAIAEKWGGGRFRFQVLNAKGQIIKTQEYHHAKTPAHADPAKAHTHAPIYQGPSPLDAVLVRLEELTRRIDAPRQDAAGIQLRDILPLLRPTSDPLPLKELLSLIVQQRQQTPLGEVLAAMEQLRALTEGARDAGGARGDDGGEELSTIVQALKGFIAVPGAPGPTPPAAPIRPPSPTPPRPPPSENAAPMGAAEFSNSALHEAASILQVGFRIAGDPALYAQFAIDTLGEDFARGLLTGPMPDPIKTTLAAYLPIETENGQQWLGRVLAEAQRILSEPDTIT